MRNRLSLFLVLSLLLVISFDSVSAQLPTKDKYANNPWQDIHVDEIKKTQKEVETFVPGERPYIATRGIADYLQLAVSGRAREEWLKSNQKSDIRQSPNNRIDPALGALAAAAAQKLPLYKPGPKNFAFRNPAEERLMSGALKPSATRKILKIGLWQNNCEIYKDSLGLPGYRFKRGYIWARDSADDYPYCKLYYISIVEDYAGGGSYAAPRAHYEETNLFGCP